MGKGERRNWEEQSSVIGSRKLGLDGSRATFWKALAAEGGFAGTRVGHGVMVRGSCWSP